MKWLFLILILLLAAIGVTWWVKYSAKSPNKTVAIVKPGVKKNDHQQLLERLDIKADQAVVFCTKKKYNTNVCFLIDMKQPSGKKRFFIYDLNKRTIMYAGMVAHGSCNTSFLVDSKFDNTPGCGCSSIGKYKVGQKYNGQLGTAYKLHGLDSSNANAFKRFVVLHAYQCVPDFETYPLPICNSLGCPMVSHKFMEVLTSAIKDSKKPILLWVFK